jgi:hypothetical protein
MLLSRRNLLLSGASISAMAVAGCASITNPTTDQVTYGLDPTVVAFITTAVQTVAKYAPTIESIAATAASIFGPVYATVVTAGSAAVNTVIAALQNLVPSLPVGARRMGVQVRSLSAAAAASGTLVGYTTKGVPVYAR